MTLKEFLISKSNMINVGFHKKDNDTTLIYLNLHRQFDVEEVRHSFTDFASNCKKFYGREKVARQTVFFFFADEKYVINLKNEK